MSRIPTQAEYESAEARRYHAELLAVEKAPLNERKEAKKDLLNDMRCNPRLIAERISWLIGGNYGYGAYIVARRIADSTTGNKLAQLLQIIGALEWRCPGRYTTQVWKQLTGYEKAMLNAAIWTVLAEYELEKESGE